MVKHITIINLDASLLKQNISAAVNNFAFLISTKKKSADFKTVKARVVEVLQSRYFNEFNLGRVDEITFTHQMINLLYEKSKIRLTIEDFDNAWNEMNPKFTEFSGFLNHAIEYNNRPEHKIIFIGFTNPKDINHLIGQLNANQFAFRVNNGRLIEIGGIPLYTTYLMRQSGRKVLEAVVKNVTASKPSLTWIDSLSYFGSWMNSMWEDMEGEPEIRYIYCKRDLIDPVLDPLRASMNQSIELVEEKARELSISGVEWNSSTMSLPDILYRGEHISLENF